MSSGKWESESRSFDPTTIIPDGACFALAAPNTEGDLFAMIRPSATNAVFLYDRARRLGRTQPQILAMTAWDGKLFGVGNDGTIYCRETSPVDLVWSPICRAPVSGGMTYSLAAYYGRLYALAGPLRRGIEVPPEKITGRGDTEITCSIGSQSTPLPSPSTWTLV